MNKREEYMLGALHAIASFGKRIIDDDRKNLRPYMDRRGIKWDNDEDVKMWMQRIAQDAIDYFHSEGSTESAP